MEFLYYFGEVATPMAMALLIGGTIGGLILGATPGLSPTMAVALLTTLYGAFMANVICIPVKNKLLLRAEQEKLNQQLILDAILGIQDGQNPRVIEGMLRNYLAESKRAGESEENE